MSDAALSPPVSPHHAARSASSSAPAATDFLVSLRFASADASAAAVRSCASSRVSLERRSSSLSSSAEWSRRSSRSFGRRSPSSRRFERRSSSLSFPPAAPPSRSKLLHCCGFFHSFPSFITLIPMPNSFLFASTVESLASSHASWYALRSRWFRWICRRNPWLRSILPRRGGSPPSPSTRLRAAAGGRSRGSRRPRGRSSGWSCSPQARMSE